MKIAKTSLSLAIMAFALTACGGDDTRYVDRVTEVPGDTIENPVEYMPVDGHVLGFWVMDADADCEEFCVNDYSAYGNPLYALDGNYQELEAAPRPEEGGAVGGVLGFDGTYQLSTRENSVLANTVIGEAFALHVRARSAADPQGSVFSLGSQGALAFDLQMNGAAAVLNFPNQERRLVVALGDAGTWQELWVGSDGNHVTVQLDCETVAEFDRSAGMPILSSHATGAMVGAAWGSTTRTPFQGDVDLVRLSGSDEANLFCPESD